MTIFNTMQNFDEEQAVNVITNTFNYNSISYYK